MVTINDKIWLEQFLKRSQVCGVNGGRRVWGAPPGWKEFATPVGHGGHLTSHPDAVAGICQLTSSLRSIYTTRPVVMHC